MNFEGITKECMREVDNDTFVLMAQADILERSDLWELGRKQPHLT